MQTFESLGIDDRILPVLAELGYESPSPIQAQSIPELLAGKDLLAQAQTGTGKTGAFALPVLSCLDLSLVAPQAIILAPTRELAIQVAESFQRYAKNLPGFHVLPIYGGQDYRPQLRALERGVHVVVGTPGRVMDHLRRGTLSTKHLKMMILDEADEMLNMGFLDDVQWILEQIPNRPQTALFSATMPPSIRNIANRYLSEPAHIQIVNTQKTVSSIEQLYMVVSRANKIEALTRFLEIEDADGIIIFTRTKTATIEVAERLEARGFAVAAINGDLKQEARERVIKRIKSGQIDIIVATEIAARGLDVERLTHVINYDIPYDVESYIHRIGRTGRAGRQGKALSFIEPREGKMLREIEHAVKIPLKALPTPSLDQLQKKRIAAFTAQIRDTLLTQDLDEHRALVESIIHDGETDILDVAAALVYLSQKEKLFAKTTSNFDELSETLESGRRYSEGGGRRSSGRSSSGDGNFSRKKSNDRRFSEKKSDGKFGEKKFSDRKPDGKFGEKKFADRKPDGKFGEKKFADRKPDGKFGEKKFADKKPDGKFGEKKFADKKPDGKFGEKKFADKKPDGKFGEKKFADKKSDGKKPWGRSENKAGFKPKTTTSTGTKFADKKPKRS